MTQYLELLSEAVLCLLADHIITHHCEQHIVSQGTQLWKEKGTDMNKQILFVNWLFNSTSSSPLLLSPTGEESGNLEMTRWENDEQICTPCKQTWSTEYYAGDSFRFKRDNASIQRAKDGAGFGVIVLEGLTHLMTLHRSQLPLAFGKALPVHSPFHCRKCYPQTLFLTGTPPLLQVLDPYLFSFFQSPGILVGYRV